MVDESGLSGHGVGLLGRGVRLQIQIHTDKREKGEKTIKQKAEKDETQVELVFPCLASKRCREQLPHHMVGKTGPKSDKIDTKLDKSGTLKNNFQYILVCHKSGTF